MYKCYLNIVILIIAIIVGCEDSNLVQSTLTPGFVFNKIHCSAKVYYRNDTVITTQLHYGLDGYFRQTYGRVTNLIITINDFVDTTHVSSVPENPDPIYPPAWSIQISIPNILENADSVKLYAKIFGVYFTDSTKQNINGEFFHFDSATVRIQRIQMDLPAHQRLPAKHAGHKNVQTDPKGVPLGLAAVR